jgi:hypothetical protein
VAAPEDGTDGVATIACVALANSVIGCANVPAVIRANAEATVDANVMVPDVVPAVNELIVAAVDGTENEMAGGDVNP